MAESLRRLFCAVKRPLRFKIGGKSAGGAKLMALMGLGIKLGVNFFDTAIAYERLRPYYCEDNGRPGIDPVVLIKMALLEHLYGLPSLWQTHRHHAEQQGPACQPGDREHLWCNTLTHNHHPMRAKLHGHMSTW